MVPCTPWYPPDSFFSNIAESSDTLSFPCITVAEKISIHSFLPYTYQNTSLTLLLIEMKLLEIISFQKMNQDLYHHLVQIIFSFSSILVLFWILDHFSFHCTYSFFSSLFLFSEKWG